MAFEFNTIKEALDDLKLGKPVVVADDEARENEGDLILPANCVTPDWVNFMIKECRGLVCLAIEQKTATRLNLTPMVEKNTDVKKTAFTQSVDADVKYGVTTGISAFDRAKTIEVITDINSNPLDLRAPGHVFPLIAKEGGVLKRVGHTEAGVDLARLAGVTSKRLAGPLSERFASPASDKSTDFEPAAAICEIINEDGSMARRDDLFKFAKKFGLKFITVEQLIKYRLEREKFVTRKVKTTLPTKFGEFEIYGYLDVLTGVEHVALVKNDDSDKIPIVRMHSECLTGDIFHSLKCDCNQQLHTSLEMINAHGKGALVYLCDHEGRGIGLINKLMAYCLQDKGQDTIEANVSLGFENDLRDYGVGAQILLDLGYEKFNLITNNPKKIIALNGYGLEVLERVSIKPAVNAYNEKYIKTKKNKMQHLY